MANSPAGRIGAILEGAERDCANHTFHVNVLHTPAKPPSRRIKVLAGILRVLAENTDGRCAVRAATDASLTTTGAIFHFTSDAKRDEFIIRIRVYMDQTSQRQLSVSKV